MNFIHEIIKWTPPLLAVLGCVLGWAFLAKTQESADVPRWRRVAATAALILVSASIAFGAFAAAYWMRSTEPGPGPPRATYIATYIGFDLALVAAAVLLFAKGRTRAMLVLSSVGLFGFYFLMFLSP